MVARSKSFGTKKIEAGSPLAREITRFIDERRAKSTRGTALRASRPSGRGRSLRA